MSSIAKKWKSASGFFRAFLILALVFLLVGLGTLGSVRSTGGSFALEKGATVVVKLTPDEEGAQKTLKAVYLNVGAVYNEVGENATMRIRRGSYSASSEKITWYSSGFGEFKIGNLFSTDGKAVGNADYNWFMPFDLSKNTTQYSITTYSRYEFTVQSCGVLINEIAFVADDGTLIQAEVDVRQCSGVDATKAEKVVDSQSLPNLAQSSFFRFGQQEAYSLTTVSEMGMGRDFADGNVYHIDREYNTLGNAILGLGTLVFGRSQFGLRFFPMLASFGILFVGFYLVSRLFASEKAGFVFAILYALAGATLSLGHLGTPLTIGVFFWVLSVNFVHIFYQKGMRKGNIKSGLSLLGGGLSVAASICVHGAFVIPAIGTVGLFVAGMFRQRTAKQYYLNKAEENAEKIAQVKATYRDKNRIAITLFSASLVVGVFLLSLLALIPNYFALVKAYDNPASPTKSLFSLMWQAFVGGFTGENVLSYSNHGWSFLTQLFVGSGERYAITLALFNGVALLAGAVAVVYAIVRLILVLARKEKGKETRALVRSLTIPLAGLLLSIVTAIFASQPLVFILASYVFAFALCAGAFLPLKERAGKILFLVGITLLAVAFAVSVPVIFSIPLPASWASILL